MINVDFNFFSEVREGQDPDSKSPTLKKYHKLLWSKPLPSGKIFDLKEDPPELSKNYLYHKSELGYFVFGSDAITHSYRNHKKKKHITEQIPDEVSDLFNQGANIASYIIFPKNMPNLNQSLLSGFSNFDFNKPKIKKITEIIKAHSLISWLVNKGYKAIRKKTIKKTMPKLLFELIFISSI